MVQSPSWEANWFAASQEIPRISRNPKVHYRTHKRPPQSLNHFRFPDVSYRTTKSFVIALKNFIKSDEILLRKKFCSITFDRFFSGV